MEDVQRHTHELFQSLQHSIQAQVSVRVYAEEEAVRLRWARGRAEDQARDSLNRLQHLRQLFLSVQQHAARVQETLFATDPDGAVNCITPLPSKSTISQVYGDLQFIVTHSPM
jgi:hypothetical protein